MRHLTAKRIIAIALIFLVGAVFVPRQAISQSVKVTQGQEASSPGPRETPETVENILVSDSGNVDMIAIRVKGEKLSEIRLVLSGPLFLLDF